MGSHLWLRPRAGPAEVHQVHIPPHDVRQRSDQIKTPARGRRLVGQDRRVDVSVGNEAASRRRSK